MKYKWLYRSNSATTVIVFFSGWGFEDDSVEHLKANIDTDVLFVNDYTDINTELPNLSGYQQRHMIAWSFGVGNYIAWQQHRAELFNQKVAINGTIQPINRQLGIAEKVVQHTIDTLSIESYHEFLARCQNSKSLDIDHRQVDIQAKKTELIKIKERSYNIDCTIKWDNVWIGKQDKIFSVANQERAWHSTPVQLIDTPHMPFLYWSNWQELLA